jgi:hypothetical protein
MSSTKTTKLPGGFTRETKRYDNGSSKSVVSKPNWYGGRDIKSVTRSDGKKR